MPARTLSLAAPDAASNVEQRLILLREPALREKEGDREAILRCWAFSRVQSSAVQSQLDRTKQKTLYSTRRMAPTRNALRRNARDLSSTRGLELKQDSDQPVIREARVGPVGFELACQTRPHDQEYPLPEPRPQTPCSSLRELDTIQIEIEVPKELGEKMMETKAKVEMPA